MFLACLISSIVLPIITMPMILRRIPNFMIHSTIPIVFLNSHTVNDWLESSSHVIYCKICVPSSSVANIKISVLWQNVSYMVCSYLDGKIWQCLLSPEDLQSCRYSHCGLVSRRLGFNVMSCPLRRLSPLLSSHPQPLFRILLKTYINCTYQTILSPSSPQRLSLVHFHTPLQ